MSWIYEKYGWNYFGFYLFTGTRFLHNFHQGICPNPMLIWRESPTAPNVMSLGIKFQMKNALPAIRKSGKGSLFKKDIMLPLRLREKNVSAAIANIMEKISSLSVLILQNLITLSPVIHFRTSFRKRMQGLS